jgi:hypothetical protein
LSTDGSNTRGNDAYLDGLLKSLDVPKHIVEPIVHALQIAPHGPRKASNERGKEDGGKNILVRPAYELEENCFDESGHGASVDSACRERVILDAYNTVKMGTTWYASTGTNLYSVDEMNEKESSNSFGMGMVTLR